MATYNFRPQVRTRGEKANPFAPVFAPDPVAEYRREHPDRLPLMMKGRCVLPDDVLYEHMRIAREQNLPQLAKAQWPPYEESVLIVGSGLSTVPLLGEIKARAATCAVMALKGAHDWLIDNGVVPTYAVASDPQESRHDCFKNLNDDTIYLLASQMHPATWPYMRGRKVVMWHSEQGADHKDREGWKGVPLVFGGSTTGLRGITLAYLLGFRSLELYGIDSCVQDGIYKLDGTPLREADAEIDVFVGERKFRTSLSMVPQVTQLRDVLALLPGIKVEAHGDGYFQEHLKAGKTAGWPV